MNEIQMAWLGGYFLGLITALMATALLFMTPTKMNPEPPSLRAPKSSKDYQGKHSVKS